jgi:AraC-like DNA-binding protein
MAAAVQGHEDLSDFVNLSWQRSLGNKLDPASGAPPTILTSSELIDARGPLERVALIVVEELDRLFCSIRHGGYIVLLCNANGVIIEHRGERNDQDQYRFWGSCLGAIWSEDVEGTNGVGTCIIERRPITIHRSQHFRSRHIALSCSSAPIFDHKGSLIAVLDAASIFPDVSESSHALAGAMVVATAAAIEERLFRDTFKEYWICAARTEWTTNAGILFALDRDLRIVGAALGARPFLDSQDVSVSSKPYIWDVFQKEPSVFRAGDRVDQATHLTTLDGQEELLALITPPDPGAVGVTPSGVPGFQHTQPRLDRLSLFTTSRAVRYSRGGITARAARRVHDFVATQLDQPIDLKSMAAAAGLSTHHFARAFKESEGVTPLEFVMARRIERSKQLLISSEASLAEVAIACGFADQSHFSRRFRQFTGATPGAFRAAREAGGSKK